jgi:hypothetical protein
LSISKDLGKPLVSLETARVGKSGGVAVFQERTHNQLFLKKDVLLIGKQALSVFWQRR